MRGLLAFALIACPLLTLGQTVSPMESGSSVFREVVRAAKKEQFQCPDLAEGDSGTFLIFTSDKNNADLTVVTSGSMAAALKSLKEVALAVGLPKTDFIVRQGTIMGVVDMEFNDAMIKSEKEGSFTFPLSRLIKEISSKKFPEPMVVALENDVESAVLRAGSEQMKLKEPWTLMSTEEAQKWESFMVKDSMAWWAPIAGWGLFLFIAGMIIGMYGVFGWMTFRQFRKLKEPPAAPAPPKTPEEVQADYDKLASRPWWKKAIGIFPALIVLPLLLTKFLNVNLERALTQASYGVPFTHSLNWVQPRHLIFIFLPLFLMAPLLAIVQAKVKKKEVAGGPKTPHDEEMEGADQFLRPVFGFVLPLMMILFFTVIAFPGVLRSLPNGMAKPVIFTVTGLPIGTVFFLTIRQTLAARSKVLPVDGFIAQEARRLGEQSGIKVKKVLMKESSSANAWATFFGTVGVTSSLKERFEEDEIRAILAHEVGHLKAMDVPRLFWTSIFILALLFAAEWFIGRMDNGIGRVVNTLSGPLNIIALPLIVQFLMAPRRQKAELAADRFAVQVTGDLDLVAHTLIKIHDANNSPHRLTRWDERMSSHPALTTRLKKLYEAVGQLPPEAISLPPHPPQG